MCVLWWVILPCITNGMPVSYMCRFSILHYITVKTIDKGAFRKKKKTANIATKQKQSW
jgi:hypothetical protein